MYTCVYIVAEVFFANPIDEGAMAVVEGLGYVRASKQ